MNAGQSNKLRAYQAVEAVLDEHEATWNTLPAFVTGVNEFTALIPEINELVQTQASRAGASDEKAFALEALGNAAHEVAAAVRAYAVATNELELAGRVDFSRSDITYGRESEVVAHCRDIHATATANVDDLADYGVTPAKLNAFKKKIDAFEAVQPKPRQKIAVSSAATKTLPERFTQADTILSKRLDGLMVQFRESAPAFYNEYRAARSVVDIPGGHKVNGNGNGNGTPTPTPTPEQVHA